MKSENELTVGKTFLNLAFQNENGQWIGNLSLRNIITSLPLKMKMFCPTPPRFMIFDTS